MLSSLVLFLALSSTQQAASAPSISPPAAVRTCSTVTRVQIRDAVGRRVEQRTEEHSRSACTITYSADDIDVTISVQHLAKPLDLAAEIESLKAAFPGSKIREIKDIAERAVALDIPDAGTQLHILPDEREYLLVSVLGLGDADRGFNAAMQIARALMSKQ